MARDHCGTSLDSQKKYVAIEDAQNTNSISCKVGPDSSKGLPASNSTSFMAYLWLRSKTTRWHLSDTGCFATTVRTEFSSMPALWRVTSSVPFSGTPSTSSLVQCAGKCNCEQAAFNNCDRRARRDRSTGCCLLVVYFILDSLERRIGLVLCIYLGGAICTPGC